MEGQSEKYMVRANDDTDTARPAGSLRQDKVVRRKWWAPSTDRRGEQGFRQRKLDRLILLGIHPESLTGRLRLVLSVGCYDDFRFTRDILSSCVRNEQIEQAIDALIDLGAHCDCGVFQAVGQMPRAVLWHHPSAHGAG